MLAKDESVSLDCPIRPDARVPRRRGRERRRPAPPRRTPTRRSSRTCRGSSRSTSSAAPREAVDRMLEQEKADPARRSCPGSRHRPRPRAQGRRSGSPPPSRCRASWSPCCPRSACSARRGLHLLAAGNTTAEAVDVIFAEAPSYGGVARPARRALREPSGRGAASSPWTRCSTRACRCCASCRAAPRPRPGLQPGDVVLAVDGQPVKRHRRAAGRGRPRRSRATS